MVKPKHSMCVFVDSKHLCQRNLLVAAFLLVVATKVPFFAVIRCGSADRHYEAPHPSDGRQNHVTLLIGMDL